MARVALNCPYNNVYGVVQLYQLEGANTSISKYFEDNVKLGKKAHFFVVQVLKNKGVHPSLQLYYPTRTLLWTICKKFGH